MMGRTHAMTGVLAGLVAGRSVGLDSIPELLPFASITAGYALFPDLDHPNATATRVLGPVTGALSRVLRAASAGLYAKTKGPQDEPEGRHRHLTHTLVFALLLGGICAASIALSPWAALAWLAFGLVLAADRLGKIALVVYAVGVAAGLSTAAAAGQPVDAFFTEHSAWLWLAVTLGCVVHCLGDMVTESGCPLLWLPWPLTRLTTWRGETWYEVRPPKVLRFRTNGRFERLVVVPVTLIASCVAALPLFLA